MEGNVPMKDQTITKRNLTDELIRGVFMLLFFIAARLVSVLVVFIALFRSFELFPSIVPVHPHRAEAKQ